MYIQVEETPNEHALKFMVEGLCESNLVFDYEMEDTQQKPHFVDRIFNIGGIQRVFVSHSFITITKTEKEDFNLLKPEIFSILFEATINGDKVKIAEEKKEYETLDEISKQIIEILEDRIQPAVAMDGGEISFISFDSKTGIVYLKLKGSCHGCPSAAVTLQQGIKRTLQHYIPEVYDVAAV